MSVTRRGLLWFLAWCSSEFQIQLRSQAVVRSSQRIQLRSHVISPGGGCSPPSPPPGSANGHTHKEKRSVRASIISSGKVAKR